MSSLFNRVRRFFKFYNEDERFLLRSYQVMNLLSKKCRDHRMNQILCNPPHIPYILSDIQSLVKRLHEVDNNILRRSKFLRLFIDNLMLKCEETLKLFNTKEINHREFAKLSLIFCHMQNELDFHFGFGRFHKFKFEARNFWTRNFGEKTMVPWLVFLEAFQLENPVEMRTVNFDLLKATMDLTGDGYISDFEFHVFTQLFSPYKDMISIWKKLTTDHPGYCHLMTYEEVLTRLKSLSNKPGSYIFRFSCTRPGNWIIGRVASDGTVHQDCPTQESIVQALHEGGLDGSLIHPNGLDENVDLAEILELPEVQNVDDNDDEEEEIYKRIGTTFKICKICSDNDKNRKIEPCGHLICNVCFIKLEETSEGRGPICPFCRRNITHVNPMDNGGNEQV